MKSRNFVIALILFGFGTTFVLPQRLPVTPRDPSNPVPEFVYRNAEKRRELERNIDRGESELENTDFDPRANREAARKKKIANDERKRIEAVLAPNPEDKARFSHFLELPNTGLIRLIPDFGCKNQSVIYVEGDCVNSVPHGWHYSFRWNDYIDNPFFSDVRIDSELLVSDGFLAQGILVSLGLTDLNNLSADSDGINYLTKFQPALIHSEAKKQYAEFAAGIDSGNFNYSNRTQIKLNSTYALRSIAYKSDRKPKIERKDGKLVTADDQRFSLLKEDTRSDITVVFQVVRVETNGGITIVWKEIVRKNAPTLEIPKGEKLTDIK